jgi:hypothetical protein
MMPTFARQLDALSGWRTALAQRVTALADELARHQLADGAAHDALDALRRRLAGEKLVVAFVAEFSRGKSELINAIFFADAGRRVLPAAPGRTTMCPVELAYDPAQPPTLALLPITSRLEGLSLSELRAQPQAWTRTALNIRSPEELSQALTQVMRTRWVSKDEARTLGFWDDARPDDNPPLDDRGRVEVPEWRHALINYPHPMLRQGLVVLDTPGLNAIGAEPELTLGLLPAAHATVFILGADTGVTKSDLAIWRDHLGTNKLARFVVLNKIDTMADPLASAQQVAEQIESQRQSTAHTLEVPVTRVFPLSARQALAARVGRDPQGLARSRLPELEAALSSQLLPQRRRVLRQVVCDAAQQIELQVSRRLGDQRRQLAEQMLELRGLRGKSVTKIRAMLQRVEAETAEFELCTTRLQALRAVQSRMLKDALAGLGSDRLRDEVERMQSDMRASILNLGARKAFIELCARLRGLLDSAQAKGSEMRDMLAASFGKLNAEFAFGLSMPHAPDLERYSGELDLIERSYVQYLGLTHALRLSQPAFMDQFRRMLVSKLRVVFENANAELELWSKSASAQIDIQLRERRRSFKRRHEALQRIQSASGELEQRIAELEKQDARLQAVLARIGELGAALREQAGDDSDADSGFMPIEAQADDPATKVPSPVHA